MPTTVPCFEARQLERLLAGDVSAEELDSATRHLEECRHCAERMDGLLKHDTLMELARTQTTVDDGPEADAVRGLIERIRGLRTVSLGAESTEELYPFLAPPQQPDEMGRLGGYRVLKVLGSGGMGVVFLAEDPRLKRSVALKVLKPEAANKPAARQRFLFEAQSAARIKHDHVVTIYQVSEDRGVPFLAMEHLQGESMDEWLKRGRRPTTAQLLRIGREIARGLAAAHEKGVIHRDVKPGNIWLESPTGRVKILDFGLARDTLDNLHLTQSGAIVGTPNYMSPEQGQGRAADHRSDLFSLGCVLYRLAAGRTPFRGETTMAVLTSLAVDHPQSVQELNPNLPGPLAELLMMLLAKNPKERPSSAADVVRQLQVIERSLTPAALRAIPAQPFPTQAAAVEVPTVALPVAIPLQPPSRPLEPTVTLSKPSPLPRRRRRVPIVAAAVLLGLLGLGAWLFGVTVYRVATNQGELVVQVDDPNVEVEVRQNDAIVKDRTSKRSFVLRAVGGEVGVYEKDGVGPLTTKTFTLNRGGRTIVGVTVEELANARGRQAPRVVAGSLGQFRRDDADPYELKVAAGDASTAAPELVAVLGQSRLKHRSGVYGVSWSPNGKHLAACDYTGFVRIWDAATGQQVARVSRSVPRAVAYGPGGELAVGVLMKDNLKGVWVGDPLTGKERWSHGGHRHYVLSLAWSPDGKLASADGEGVVKVWDETGKELFTVRGGAGNLNGVAFSHDGSRLAFPGEDGKVKVLDVKTQKAALAPESEIDSVRCVAFSSDGKLLAAGDQNRQVKVWDTATGKERRPLSVPGICTALVFSPDSRWLAASGNGSLSAVVWDTATWQERKLPPGRNHIHGLAFSPDSNRLASSDAIGILRVWDVQTGSNWIPSSGHEGSVHGVAVSPDARWIVSCGNDGTLRLWTERGSDQILFDYSGPLYSVAVSPDASAVALGDQEGWVLVWDRNRKVVRSKARAHTAVVHDVCFSPDGKRLASASQDGTVKVLNAQTCEQLAVLRGHEGTYVRAVAFSPDGKRLATGGYDKTARVWDVATGKEIHRLDHVQGAISVSFSPDGKRLLTAGTEHTPRVWDVETGKLIHTLQGHRGDAPVAAYSPSGEAIVSIDLSGWLIVWEAATGKILREVQLGKDVIVQRLAVAPDGRHVVTANENGTLYVLRLDGALDHIKFSPATPAWVEKVRGLKAEARVGAVVEELLRRNPGFDGQVEPTIQGNEVVELTFKEALFRDLEPLRALPNLVSLRTTRTTFERSGPALDLAPLRGMPLRHLELHYTNVKDLAPLQGMPLEYLAVNVANSVKDLSPLTGMKLKFVQFATCNIRDLSPLKGMPLKSVYLGGNPVEDLSPLKGMPLISLYIGYNNVSELTPLQGMPLASLAITSTKVTDLTPLEGMPLDRLYLDVKQYKGIDVLWRMKSLQTVNHKRVAEFRKEYEEKFGPPK